ncbi:MAG: D-2-hydroxyacid dehydrogenase [Bacteroidota bacterium]
MPKPKIVIFDGYAANPNDLSWEPIARRGNLKVYDRTPDNLVYQRGKAAEIAIVNKRELDWYYISSLRKLKLICTLATGYNNVDIDAANHFGITVCNAVGYSSPSVAQHVFALLLELINRVGLHNADVQKNGWANSLDWCYWKSPITELAGKTMGIYGYGKIGQKVADIALAFDLKVIVVRQSNRLPANTKVQLVDLETLWTASDVISLHAPLTDSNAGIINQTTLAKMKKSAYLINTGRGGLVNENDLKIALEKGQIAGAGLDVLSQEPPPKDHLLLGVPNCLITPHQAWATKESRARLIEIVGENIGAFLAGKPQNVVSQ